MGRVHKDFSVSEYVRSLRREIRMEKREMLRAMKEKRIGEAAQIQGGIEILEWVVDDLRYYAKNGKFQ